MNWHPISEEKIWDIINLAWDRMSIPQRRFWKMIRITPEKWKQHPYGTGGGGFWVVALLGKRVVWYNDLEEGFNRSTYHRYGEIGDYWCNQDNLEWTIQHLMNEIESGEPSGGFCGPPKPIV